MIKSQCYPVRARQREVIQLFGRWVGNGTGAPTVATRADGGKICKGLTLTRTGVGLYTLTVDDGGVPFFLGIGVRVISATQIWVAQVLTFVESTGTITMQLSVGGAATDPANTEKIWAEVVVANAGQP